MFPTKWLSIHLFYEVWSWFSLIRAESATTIVCCACLEGQKPQKIIGKSFVELSSFLNGASCSLVKIFVSSERKGLIHLRKCTLCREDKCFHSQHNRKKDHPLRLLALSGHDSRSHFAFFSFVFIFWPDTNAKTQSCINYSHRIIIHLSPQWVFSIPWWMSEQFICISLT